jgi:DNA-directed RNA polymerase subunit RPC12/RpoP
MSIPMTRSCPQCEAEMELLTADDDGEIVVYECPDCGSQIEAAVHQDESEGDDHASGAPPDADEAQFEELEPDDAS